MEKYLKKKQNLSLKRLTNEGRKRKMCEQSRKKEEEKKTKWARRVGKKKSRHLFARFQKSWNHPNSYRQVIVAIMIKSQ